MEPKLGADGSLLYHRAAHPGARGGADIVALDSVPARAARLVLLLALASPIAACGESADHAAPAPASAGGPGRILYLTHCQGCHGLDGRGDGPAAASLRTRPTDLTRLWQRYGTPLDRERLTAYVDGRGLLEVHGPREMPVWGDEFFEDAPPLTPNLVEGAKRHLIDVLADYLESIQTERRS
jgi:mono/diheme cytochrome c family protein